MSSEQVSLDSFAEASERLCSPDIDRELVPPLRFFKTEKSSDFDDQPKIALSYGGTRHPAEVVEQSARAGVCDLTNAWR